MKLIHLTLLATSLILSSCLSPEQKATLSNNALQDANAALVGGLTTGTWAGAAAGASAQVLKNHLPEPKNPGKSVTPQ